MDGDFKFVKDIFEDFLKQKNIKQMFGLIVEEPRINDFEKWLQIELAYFLQYCRSDVRNVQREIGFDLRANQAATNKSVNKKKTIIDFVIERKGTAKEHKILIEIKRKKSVNGCVKGMLADARLIKSAKGNGEIRKNDIRSKFLVGIHPPESEGKSIDTKLDAHKGRKNLLKVGTIPVKGSNGFLELTIIQVE